jgi:hypothetical protein
MAGHYLMPHKYHLALHFWCYQSSQVTLLPLRRPPPSRHHRCCRSHPRSMSKLPGTHLENLLSLMFNLVDWCMYSASSSQRTSPSSTLSSLPPPTPQNCRSSHSPLLATGSPASLEKVHPVLFGPTTCHTLSRTKKVLIEIYCIKKCLLDLDPI